MYAQDIVKSKHVNSYSRGYAMRLKEQQLKVGMSLMVEVEKVLQVSMKIKSLARAIFLC